MAVGREDAPRHAPTRSRPTATRAVPIIVGIALVLGLGLRIALLTLAPRYGYFGDHDDYVRWGIQAVDRGITTLYQAPPPRHPALAIGEHGEISLHEREVDRILNYPPLAAYVLWLEGTVHERLDASRIVNTLLARALFAALAILADVVVAWGCFALVRGVAGRLAAAIAFAAAFLAPPLALDGAFWGQTDAWLLAPSVWMVHAMEGGRWRRAGVLWGVALGLKTQAVLFAPLWLAAALVARPRRAVLEGAAIAVVALNVAALPFWLSSGGNWFYYAFTDNLLHQYAESTLFAFNLWYVDLLLTGTRDSTAALAGLARDTWGRLFTIVGVLAGYGLLVRRWRGEPLRWTLLAGWILLVAVMVPTRVHERYIVLCLPFLICAATRVRGAGYGVAGLVAAGTFQITVNNWQTFLASNTVQDFTAFYYQYVEKLTPEQRNEFPPLEYHLKQFWEQRAIDLPKEWGLVALALVSAAWVIVALVLHAPPAPAYAAPAERS